MLRLAPLAIAATVSLSASVLRLEVLQQSDVLAGKPFASAGPYERIVARAYFGVDPRLAANRIICDIDRARRDAAGLVRFSADLYVLRPRDPKAGNGTALFEVSNRGGKGMLRMFDFAAAATDPHAVAEFGDGFLLAQGYTLVWLGWQPDVPRDPGLLRLNAPAARGATGLVRSEFVPDRPATTFSLADRTMEVIYPAIDPGSATLTVRDSVEAPRRVIPREQWRFEDATKVFLAAGFSPGRIYECVYRSQDPVLVGLGPAAVRDLFSFLKYGGTLAGQRGSAKRVIGFGVSQSGRFLRTFLYYGFNQDEQGRKVFDGAIVHVAGGGRGSFNHRFAQPSRDAHPFFNLFYPTDIFPFTDLAETDPETGLSGGLLDRAAKAGVVPKIFYTNSSYEYYGRAASLIHTTIDGRQDARLAADTRIYLLAGGQHGPAAFPPPPRHGTQNLTNPNDYRWSLRALLVAMNNWIAVGKQPPPSAYPRLADGRLAPLDALRFPKIPGVAVPTRIHLAYRVDYGPDFRTLGIVSVEPPRVGRAFPMLVPQVDADGNETSGVRLPEIQAPLATYTGWNLRDPSIGAPEELYSMAGSWIPFARTRAEREKTGDPRLSLEERYRGRDDYLKRIEAAASALARAGYLLEADVPQIVERAGRQWDYCLSSR